MFSCWGWSAAQVLIGHGQLVTLWTTIQHLILPHNTRIIWSHFVVGSYNTCHRITWAIQSWPFNTCCHLFQLQQTISIKDQRGSSLPCQPKNSSQIQGEISELEITSLFLCHFSLWLWPGVKTLAGLLETSGKWIQYEDEALVVRFPSSSLFSSSAYSPPLLEQPWGVDGRNSWDLRAWSWSGQQQQQLPN